MSSLSNSAIEALAIIMGLLASSSCTAEPGSPKRLPHQKFNRMLYIKGEGKTDLYVNMPNHYDVGSPTFSPDGKSIAFDAMTIGDSPIRESWVVGVDGKNLRKLTKGAVPRWSPDGKRVVITRDANPDHNDGSDSAMFVIDLASGKEQKLRAGRLGDWSPDGKQLVFSDQGTVTNNGGTRTNSTLFLAKADGSDPEELGDGDWPSWSPDGKKIACCVHEQGSVPILWVIDLAAKKRDRLGPGFYRPQWSGDSKSVVAKRFAVRDAGKGYWNPPARFWLDKGRIDFFLMDRDNPWSPCDSRDGKSVVIVVDSEGHKKPDPEP